MASPRIFCAINLPYTLVCVTCTSMSCSTLHFVHRSSQIPLSHFSIPFLRAVGSSEIGKGEQRARSDRLDSTLTSMTVLFYSV